jgi:hypothetical protein
MNSAGISIVCFRVHFSSFSVVKTSSLSAVLLSSYKKLLFSLCDLLLLKAIRQMYVLVLGLDVLGNPFGVIRNLATGIEDLFYEPYQGLIQGPEEFAEGVVLGVKSLFGHAIGKLNMHTTQPLRKVSYQTCGVFLK